MAETRCGKPAVYRAVWGNQVVYQCEGYARQLQAVGDAMGYRPVIDPYIGAETCSQMVREKP